MSKSEERFLLDELKIIQSLLAKQPLDEKALMQEINNGQGAYRYYIRVLDREKKTIAESEDMQQALQGEKFFTKIEGTKKTTWWHSPNGKDYLLIQEMAKKNKITGEYYIIQAAMDLSYQDALGSEYDKKIAIILALAGLFSILLGYFMTRRGLGRLYDLILATENITAHSLHQRIDPKLWPNELRTLGLAFNQMLNRIETSFNHLMQFSADLAHELRTPINNILGGTEITLSRDASKEELHQMLESNYEELQRISHMIDNLLFLARAENPQLQLEKVALNISKEMQLICEYYQAMAEDKNISLHCEGSGKLEANKIMFRRMLSNILSNALKYTPPGGSIRFTAKEQGNQIEITLVDNGFGIPEEHLSKLFDRFYRVDSSRSHDQGGFGLGLAIVKSIVDLHHGHISITSKVGEGTKVVIIFPKITKL